MRDVAERRRLLELSAAVFSAQEALESAKFRLGAMAVDRVVLRYEIDAALHQVESLYETIQDELDSTE